MAQDTRANVKVLFETGDKPTQAEFATTWDSTVFWLDDVLDEDDLVSDSDVHLATQQSIKAYVDSVGGAGIQDLEDVLQQGNNSVGEDIVMGTLSEIIFGPTSSASMQVSGGAFGISTNGTTGFNISGGTTLGLSGVISLTLTSVVCL